MEIGMVRNLLKFGEVLPEPGQPLGASPHRGRPSNMGPVAGQDTGLSGRQSPVRWSA